MRIFWRIFLDLAGILSLALCCAASFLWLRSYHQYDLLRIGFWDYHIHPSYPQIVSAHSMNFTRYPGGTDVQGFYEGCISGVGKPLRTGPGSNGEHWQIYEPPKGYARARIKPVPEGTKWGFLFDRRRGPWAWRVCVPDYAVVLLSLILPVQRAAARLGRKRYTKGCCARCGYDLRATPERCPECGLAVGIRSGGAQSAGGGVQLGSRLAVGEESAPTVPQLTGILSETYGLSTERVESTAPSV